MARALALSVASIAVESGGARTNRLRLPKDRIPPMMRFLALTLALSCLGCADNRWTADTDASGVACNSVYGFPPNSPNYEKCMQKFREIESRKK